MTRLTRPVRRTVDRERRGLVVTLIPGLPGEEAQIEVREARRRYGPRVTIASLFTLLHRRAAGLPAPGARRKR